MIRCAAASLVWFAMTISAPAGTGSLAAALGSLIASEQTCGLSYDQEAIQAFIEENVPADDVDFPGMLRSMTDSVVRDIRGMSQSAKTAHCAQVQRIAKSYGFIE